MPPTQSPLPSVRRSRGSRRKRRSLIWRLRRPFFLLGLLLVAGVAGGWLALSQIELPPADLDLAQTSFMCDASIPEGECGPDNAMAQLNAELDRVDVAYDQLPQVLIDAVVATEDQDFFQHSGIDPIGIVRAAWADIQNQGAVQGGSTITQQYVKNVFLTSERTLVRKVKEAVLAIKLEGEIGKEEILGRYLNTIYFGRGAYGVQAASQGYFNVDVEDLQLWQAALLAGLIRAPEAADPERNPADAVDRRATVLDLMLQENYITQEDYDAADAVALGFPNTLPRPPGTNLGFVQGAEFGTEYVAEYVRQWLVDRFGESEVYGGGLRVYTSLDMEMQATAYRAVTGILDQPDDPAGSLVTVDELGHIKAMVGGTDFANSEVNLALGAAGGGSGRQPGSAFKPFVLAEALKQGYSAKSVYPAPGSITLDIGNGQEWRVSGGASSAGSYDLISATRASSNVVFAQLMIDVGPQAVVTTAERMGITSELPVVPSLVLGSGEVSVLDMASAFSTFMNAGLHAEPVIVTRVERDDGTLLYPTEEAELERILPEDQVEIITYALSQVISGGTGTGARISEPAAGKTGTTQDNRDAWFVGFTCRFTTAVWMGYPGRPGEPPRYMTNFRGGGQVFGGSYPADIWQTYMEQVTAGDGCPSWPVPTEFPGEKLNQADAVIIPPVCPPGLNPVDQTGDGVPDVCVAPETAPLAELPTTSLPTTTVPPAPTTTTTVP